MCIGLYRPFLGIPWGMFSRCTCTTIFGASGFALAASPANSQRVLRHGLGWAVMNFMLRVAGLFVLFCVAGWSVAWLYRNRTLCSCVVKHWLLTPISARYRRQMQSFCSTGRFMGSFK